MPGRGGPGRRAPQRPAAVLVAPHTVWPEGKLQREIISYCDDLDARLLLLFPGVPGMRLKVHHEVDSKKSRRGLPDLIIAGPGGLLIVELKRQDKAAQATVEQNEWLDTLAASGHAAYLWRPEDWVSGKIQREIQRIARPLRTPPAPISAAPEVYGCGCVKGAPHTCGVWGA